MEWVYRNMRRIKGGQILTPPLQTLSASHTDPCFLKE